MKEEIEYSLLVVGVCLIIVACIIPIVKKIAIHINALDIPDARKVHTKPIPRLGGLGIFLGFLVGYMIFGQNTIQMNSILIGSFIIVLTGMIDDIKPISPKSKLFGQLLASSVIAFYGNILLNNLNSFGVSYFTPFLPISKLFSDSGVFFRPFWKREKRDSYLNTKKPTQENDISMKWRTNGK